MSVRIQITVSVPELVMNSGYVRGLIMQKIQHKTAPDLQKMFKTTVEGWKEAPNFLQRFRNSPNEISVIVWPSQSNKGGKTWKLLNEGAPPHPILPRKAKMLRFRTGYSAGTRPRVLGSRAYSRSGNYISAQAVQHPGFEAREWTKEIADQYRETFKNDIQEAIRVAKVRSS